VDLGLYGGFASDQDRLRLQAFANPEGGDFLQPPARFDDPRYLELCRRFKARNYPDRLSNQERSDWDAFCRAKWHDKAYAGVLSLEEFQERVAVLKGSGLDVHKMEVLEETDRYVRDLVAGTP
jgi:exodeoxyribonuclease-1